MYAVIRPAAASVAKKLTRFVVLTPLFFLPQDRRIAIERRLRGREQYRKLRRADGVVVSFGKSGRTWLRVMLSRFYQVKHELPGWRLLAFDNLHLRNRAIPKIFFTHDNYLKDYTGNADSKVDYRGKRVVLLVRHPADVAVSQYHQWRHRMRPNKKALNRYPGHGEEVPIFEFVARREAGLAKAIDFMNAWARELPTMRDDLLVVRYEDMRAEPEAALARIVAFLGTPGTEAEIRDAVAFASLENMRQLEQGGGSWLTGGRLRPKDTRNPDSFKVRRGKVGGYRDYFTAEEVAEIDAIVRDRLSPVFGYATAAEPPQSAAARAAAGA